MATHAYWRLLIQSGVSNEVDCTELKWFDQHNTNTRCDTGGSTISGEVYSGSYPDTNLADGVINTGSDYATANAATFGTTKWFGYHFASPVDIKGIKYHLYNTGFAPTSFDIQYSDNGISWTTVKSISISASDWGYSAGTNLSDPVFSGTAFRAQPDTAGTGHRFWRINVSAIETSPSSSNVAYTTLAFKAGGVELHKDSTPGFGITACSGSTHAPYYAMLDGSEATTHTYDARVPFNTYGATFGYDFGTKVQPDKLRVGVYDNTYAPKDFTIEYSDDGSSWTVSDTYTGEASWSSAEVREYTVSSGGGPPPPPAGNYVSIMVING